MISSSNIEVYISLGSNINYPQKQIIDGINKIKHIYTYKHLKISSAYLTVSVGNIHQPPFINTVIKGIYKKNAWELLTELASIEKIQGRQRHEHWGPRTLDLDLLFFGSEIINQTNLIIPHPEIIHRAFVLLPLIELVPNLILPIWKKNAEELLKAIPFQERILQKIKRIKWEF